MQRTMKRVGALILAIAMLVTFMPSLGLTEQAHADEEGIKVYMTVSDKGAIAKTKDGDYMAWKEVAVKDLDADGKYTFDEALKAAHEQYNSADGYEASSSGWVSKVWGDGVSGVYSFIRNNKATDLVTLEEVEDGDYLKAAVDLDATYYSDYATYFDEYKKTVSVEEEFELTLKGFGAMTKDEGAPLAGITVGAVKDNGTFSVSQTDENGKAKFKFDEPGVYIATAEGVVRDAVSSVYATPAGQKDGKYYCSRTDWSTYDSFILYTEANHGDGPYPVDEIKEIDFYDWNDLDEDEQAAYNLVYASSVVDPQFEAYYSVLLDAPIIVPCTVITVLPEEVKQHVKAAVRNFEKDNKFDIVPQEIEVSCNAAEKYGELRDFAAGNAGKVTLADLIFTMHEMKYGDKFTADTVEDYIVSSDSGYFSKCFGLKTANISYLINQDLSMTGGIFTVTLEDGDRVDLYKYLDEAAYSDLYSFFTEENKEVETFEEFELALEGLGWSYSGPLQKSANKDLVAATYDEDGEITPIDGAVMNEEGKIKLSFSEPGTYYVTASGYVNAPVADYSQYPDITYTDADVPVVLPYCVVNVAASDIYPVYHAIDSIGEVTLDSEDAINAAEEAYEALTDEQKAKVTNYATLLKAKVALAELKVAEAQAAVDDGNRKNQTETTMNKVYSTLGMFRSLDEGTSVKAKDDKTVTVTIQLNPSKSVPQYAKIALAKYGEEDKAEIVAEQQNLEEAGKNDKDETLYTCTYTFDMPASLVGHKMPYSIYYKTETEEGWHKFTSQPYMIVLSEALVKDLAEAEAELEKAEDDLKAYLAVEKKKVTGVKVKAGKKKATVSWKSLGAGYTYKVYQLNPSKGTYKAVKTTTKTKVVVKKLKKGKKYCFKVQAQKKVNDLTAFTKESKVVKSKKIK